MTVASSSAIRAIDDLSIHKITSGQVVVDLQTAVKELIENSLDAGATNIEVRFRDHGLKSIEVIDNGSGISPEDYDSIGLKHHTSKLTSYEDLTSVLTFGFRGEAISSLCAMSESVTVTTAIACEAPMGTVIELDRNGRVVKKNSKVARQRGTTVNISGLFKPLPVRRKEFERNVKREYGKALNLLNAYALVPCAKENRGIRLAVSNQDSGRRAVAIQTDGSPSIRASVSALWGPKSTDNLVDLNLNFDVGVEKSVLRRQGIVHTDLEPPKNNVKVMGLVSKFALGCGRTGTDRQFFFVNGRPCSPSKVQKVFNEIYRSFNVNQSPFIVADFVLPTDSCDINVSPDKRTVLLHSEDNLIQALKTSLQDAFSSSRSTYSINEMSQNSQARKSTSQPNPAAPKLAKSQSSHQSRSELGQDADISTLRTPEESMDRSEDSEAPCHLDNVPDVVSSHETESAKIPLFVPTRSPSFTRPKGPAQTSSSPVQTLSLLPTPLSDASPATSHVSDQIDDLQAASPGSPCQKDVAHLFAASIAVEKEREPRNESSSSAAPPHSHLEVIKRKESSKQMVLDTTGAAWSIREVSNEPSGRPSKRVRLTQSDEQRAPERITAGGKQKGKGRMKKIGLWEFAMPGSQAGPSRESKISSSDTESEDAMEVDDTNKSRPDVRVEGKNDVADEMEDIDELDDDSVQEEQSPVKGLMTTAKDKQMDVGDISGSHRQPHFSTVKSTSKSHRDNSSSHAAQKAAKKEVPRHDRDLDIDDECQLVSAPKTARVRQELIQTKQAEQVLIDFDLSKLKSIWGRSRQLSAPMSETDAAEPLQSVTYVDDDAGFQNTDEEAAATALSRVIGKDDFNVMEVVGQFNKGFIIARRRRQSENVENVDNGLLDDLFIVDQHAADEKYNFEDLQQTTKFEAQRLVRPQPLQLSATEEMLAIENIDILQQNGFDIMVNDDEDRDPSVPRISLVGQPISKETVFDTKDLEELLHLMQDRPTGQMVRCSKVRTMLAMRACRKSIMVGLPLKNKQMTQVLRHMSTMDQPWNCPHGRPTMRHLCDLSSIPMRKPAPVDWTAILSAGVV